MSGLVVTRLPGSDGDHGGGPGWTPQERRSYGVGQGAEALRGLRRREGSTQLIQANTYSGDSGWKVLARSQERKHQRMGARVVGNGKAPAPASHVLRPGELTAAQMLPPGGPASDKLRFFRRISRLLRVLPSRPLEYFSPRTHRLPAQQPGASSPHGQAPQARPHRLLPHSRLPCPSACCAPPAFGARPHTLLPQTALFLSHSLDEGYSLPGS